MQPGEGPLDDPPEDAEAAAVWAARPRDDGDDALGLEARVARRRPVGPIALDHARFPARTSGAAAHGRQRRHQGLELGHIVHIGRRDLCDQRNAARVGDEVVFRALLTAIGWVRSSFFPPRNARTEALSMTVHRWSSRPRCRSSARSASCSRRQTPARCQRTSRRQQVLPDPQPISRGSICHGTPDRNTYKIPVNTARSGTRARPCRCPRRRRGCGIKGASRAHNASSTSGRAMPDRTKPLRSVQGVAQEF